MTPANLDNTMARWARIGVLFGIRPSRRSPDLERLLLDTARLAPVNARLFSLAVSWLSQYSNLVARHRLKRLVRDELERVARPVLGLILDLAIKHGAARNLNIAAKACGKAKETRVLFDIHAGSAARRRLAQTTACPEAKCRGLWAPDVDPKLDALRPAAWILTNNPGYRDRAIRKGDLRATILVVLRLDVTENELNCELALADLCAANRTAVKAALDDLEFEGVCMRRRDPQDHRRYRIYLSAAA